MEYKIGEVSKILKISDQMIRYYEKEGVISPKRTGDGKYRTYSVMDIFLIYEVMKYKQWNISIKNVKEIFSHDYFRSLISKIDDFSEYLRSNISKEELLLQRVQQVRDGLDICQFNLDHYWVEKTPRRYVYYSNKARGDDHDLVSIDQQMQKVVYDNDSISFFDVMVLFKEGYEDWYYAIDETYHDTLGIEDHGTYIVMPPQACLCTIIDMGEVGSFNQDCLKPLIRSATEKHHPIVSNIYGMIIGRGLVEGTFKRMMKLYAPIKTL